MLDREDIENVSIKLNNIVILQLKIYQIKNALKKSGSKIFIFYVLKLTFIFFYNRFSNDLETSLTLKLRKNLVKPISYFQTLLTQPWLNFTWTTSDWKHQKLHLVSNILNRWLPQDQLQLLKRWKNKMKRFKSKLPLCQTKNSKEWWSTRPWCTKIISSSSSSSLLSNNNSKWWTLNSKLSHMEVLKELSLLLQERSQDLVSNLRLCKCRWQHILMVNLE